MHSATRKLISTLVVIAACTSGGSSAADESQWPLITSQSYSVEEGPSAQPAGKNMIRTVASSLAIVLGVFFLVSTLFRKGHDTGKSSSELIETLGAIQVAPKVKLHLVRLGERLLVLHLSPGSVQRVAEISDPDEVRRLLGQGDIPGAAQQSGNVEDLLRAVEQQSDGTRPRPLSRGLLA